ncbi:MAG: endonuclease/exonuclease/phosphatase family protein [Candidatus Kariarchaeaceae archaeon]|jgi:exonuclease III
MNSNGENSKEGSNPVTIEHITVNDATNSSGVFSLMNLNINWCGEIPGWEEAIKNNNPDVMVLVESGCWSPNDGSLDEIVTEMNSWFPNEEPYEAVTFAAASPTDGQAIFSRFPIVDSKVVESFPLDDGTSYDITHHIMEAVIEINEMEIHLLTNHLSCCSAWEKRIKEQEMVMNYADSLGDVPIIYSGDFNSDSPEDIGELAPAYSTLKSEAIEIMLNGSHPKASTIHEWTDVYRTLNPYDPGFTFHDKNYISRLDYTFVNTHLVDAMVNASLDTTYYMRKEASLQTNFHRGDDDVFDHYPLITWFNLNHDAFDLRPPVQVHGVEIDVDTTTPKSTISWAANPENDLFKYQLWRNDCLIVEIPKDQTSFVDDYHYNPNAIYNYQIKAIDKLGNVGMASKRNYVNTSYGALSIPSTPVLTASAAAGGVQLNWTVSDTGGAPDIKYLVMRNADLGRERPPRAITTATSHLDPAPSGLLIYYWVRAYNFIGMSGYSNTASATSASAISLDLMSESMPASNPMGIIKPHVIEDCPSIKTLIDLPSPITNTTDTISSTSSDSSDSGSTLFEFMLVSFISFNMILIINRKRLEYG